MAIEQPIAGITGYHAHVHYGPATKLLAAQLRGGRAAVRAVARTLAR